MPLSAEATRALLRLAETPGQLVGREDLARAIWGDHTPPPSGVSQCIRLVRLALGDSERTPTFVETVPKRGYRLVAPVRRDGTAAVERYRTLERIGDGGMGVVYKAEDTRLKRQVALKFLPEAWCRDAEAKQRFLHEARAVAALDHPNLCTLHEVDETPDGRMFFVMALYEGETIKRRMTRGPLPWRDAAELALQVARGLERAHEHGIVHRDIKPANLMITRSGVVKILDFGVAKMAQPSGLTRTGTAMGTPTHMSPEQVRSHPVDHRTDLWSLGVVLYEMLSGQLPFRADLEHAVLFSIVTQEPAPLASLGIEVPSGLEGIVQHLLAKEADARYRHASELIADLSALLAGAEAALRFAPAPAPRPAPSIAVLPFSNLSSDRDQEYFCEGLAEELISALSKVESLRVVSRSASFRFRDAREDLRTLGETLRASSLLTGSVRRAGHRLRIVVELVDVANAYTQWSESFDRELEDVFAVQEEIARTVVRELKVKLARPLDRPLVPVVTDDVEAYQLYLRGRHHWNRRTPAALARSVSFFQRAIERDPGYARAKAGLADAYVALGIYGLRPPSEVMPAAREAAREALALDPSMAEAQVCLGAVLALFDWSWSAAEGAFRKAIDLDDRYATGHQWYAMNLLVPQGRFEAAERHSRIALELDPLSLPIQASLGVAAFFARRHQQAVEALEHALELDPDFAMAQYFLGQALGELGERERALAVLHRAVELAGGSAETRIAEACALARAGRAAEARTVAADLLDRHRQGYLSPVLLAQLAATLGESESALDDLERALELRAADLAWIAVRPAFDPLRGHPRFKALLQAMRLEEELTGSRTLIDLPRGE